MGVRASSKCEHANYRPISAAGFVMVCPRFVFGPAGGAAGRGAQQAAGLDQGALRHAGLRAAHVALQHS
eukprot:scaffold16664_cov107-Isochrysis_galbana.AAC.1